MWVLMCLLGVMTLSNWSAVQINSQYKNKVGFWMNIYVMGFTKCLNVYMQLYPPLFIPPGNPKWVHKVVLERKVIKKKSAF